MVYDFSHKNICHFKTLLVQALFSKVTFSGQTVKSANFWIAKVSEGGIFSQRCFKSQNISSSGDFEWEIVNQSFPAYLVIYYFLIFSLLHHFSPIDFLFAFMKLKLREVWMWAFIKSKIFTIMISETVEVSLYSYFVSGVKTNVSMKSNQLQTFFNGFSLGWLQILYCRNWHFSLLRKSDFREKFLHLSFLKISINIMA